MTPNLVSRIAVLGSTGSIGRSTLEVIAASQGMLKVTVLAARRSFERLIEQAEQFKPSAIVATDEEAARSFDWSGLPRETELLTGPQALENVVRRADVDTVVAALVGSVGVKSTWSAIEAGKKIALANKETLVMAGRLIMDFARQRNVSIVPIDSEHSAIFQALQAGRREDVHRLVLTASGGPFRNHSLQQLQRVTVAQALEHPIWDMGPKITIDSASMMNKALEIIEAGWLFDLPADKISVVIHPQSMVHSLVEFRDGSVVAQLSPPDMRLPIQYALSYPERWPAVSPTLDWSRGWQLDFSPPDLERFPALALGLEAARLGGTAGAVLNAANEVAVEQFLSGEIDFLEIVSLCKTVLEHHCFESSPTLEQLFAADAWARQEVLRWVCT
jgi:1-deoxy-D-xylulose-5-phosphate reductoisomerase